MYRKFTNECSLARTGRAVPLSAFFLFAPSTSFFFPMVAAYPHFCLRIFLLSKRWAWQCRPAGASRKNVAPVLGVGFRPARSSLTQMGA